MPDELTILWVDIWIRADSNKREWNREFVQMPFDVRRMKEFVQFQRNLLHGHLRQYHVAYICDIIIETRI